MNFQTLLRISRPRFWHYVLWPMLIYFASSMIFHDIHYYITKNQDINSILFYTIQVIVILWYFTLPANLWIYGWNDIADGDTDKFNSKKWSYEAKIDHWEDSKKMLKQNIWLWNIGYIIIGSLVLGLNLTVNNYLYDGAISIMLFLFNRFTHFLASISAIFLFLVFSYLYSCRPLRAKAKPFIDGIMNVLYIITPFFIVWVNEFVPGEEYFINYDLLYNFFAALFRCMAMHCYSAIPDIEPDRQAGLTTTAVYLGKQNSLIYCAILYVLSALLSFSTLWWFSLLAW
jgi:4-hydroxybenzoate polyprenyltransferase